MRHIKEVEDIAQNALFDSATLDSCSWWVTDLTDSARRELDENWQGIFRRSLLRLMPATQLGGHFHASFGRPTKELHSMAALVFIMEFKNWTLDDAVDAYTFNNGIHFALHLPNRHNYLCTRTLEEYRRLVREDEAAGEVFLQVTRTLVAALGISVARQRLDSTHLLSDMASFGRTKLLAVAVKRLLTALKRHCPESYAALPAELRERYETTLGRLFGEASTSKERRASAQLQVAQDMHQLIETFADDANIHGRSTYKDLARLFAEHCEIQDQQIAVRPKSIDSEGQSGHTLQNPSDPDAGYSGHKGAGYQVQLSETSAAENPVQLIVACLPQSAGDQDSAAVVPILAQLQGQQMQPVELAADTAYGSDENHQHAAQAGIDLISPVPGRPPTEQNPELQEQAAEPSRSPASKKRRGRPATEQSKAAQQKVQRNAQRREREQSEEWREKYRRRAGVESVNRGLDRLTGIKQLRVRGKRAVTHSVYGKVMGWNIVQSARAIRKAAIQARKQAEKAITAYLRSMKRAYRALTQVVLCSIHRTIRATANIHSLPAKGQAHLA